MIRGGNGQISGGRRRKRADGDGNWQIEVGKGRKRGNVAKPTGNPDFPPDTSEELSTAPFSKSRRRRTSGTRSKLSERKG